MKDQERHDWTEEDKDAGLAHQFPPRQHRSLAACKGKQGTDSVGEVLQKQMIAAVCIHLRLRRKNNSE